jgi:hypothetical protein
MHSQGKQSPEGSPEQSGEGQWLTYDQIGQIRGIGRESAVKLAQRKRWRREPGNDGTARVFVPGNWQGKARKRGKPPSEERSPRQSPDHSPELSQITSAFELAIASLTARAEAADRRADQAEAKAEGGNRPDRVLAEGEADLAPAWP